MSSIRLWALVLGLGAAATFVFTGCSKSGSTLVSQVQTGSAFIHVWSMGATDVAGATITVTASDIPVPLSASLTKSATGWETILGEIPAGSNRVFTLSATDASGVERYRGRTAGVTVSAKQTQDVLILAQQTSPLTGFSDSAPVIDLVQASSADVAPGATVNLVVSAHDLDAADTLTYSWASGGGTLSSTSLPDTTWTAPAATGTYLVTVTVEDSKQETVATSVQITVSTPTPPVPAPIPPWVGWLLMGSLAVAGMASLNRTGPRMSALR